MSAIPKGPRCREMGDLIPTGSRRAAIWLYGVVSVFALSAATHGAQKDQPNTVTREGLIGVWRLVRIDYSGPHGSTVDPFYQAGSTGLLIYDQGCFFQWLEGPAAGLARIWASIGRDPRHHDIQILRQQELPRRFFGSWDLRLTSRQRSALEIGGPSPAGVVHVAWPPRAVPALSIAVWDDVFAELVLPKLVARHRALPARAAPAALRGREPPRAAVRWGAEKVHRDGSSLTADAVRALL